MTDILGCICMMIGGLFMLLAAIGAVRLPDLFMRAHAITKAGTAGIGFLMLAVICFNSEVSIMTRALGVMFFISLTAPVSAHLLSRAAYQYGLKLWDRTFMDELRDYYRSGEVKTEQETNKPPTG